MLSQRETHYHYRLLYPVTNHVVVNTSEIIIDVSQDKQRLLPYNHDIRRDFSVYDVNDLEKHAITKHAVTVEIQEKTQASFNASFKMSPGEYLKEWRE